jgi:hypothetical protein
MNEKLEPTCPACKASADFRISSLYAGVTRKKDGDYKREIYDVLICNQCGAVICQIDRGGVRETLI